MIVATVRVDIDTSRIMGRFEPRYREAQVWLDHAVLRDTEQYVPYKTGALTASGLASGVGEVRYTVPHAQRMYRGTHFNFNQTFHPLASAYWFEKSKGVNLNAWVDGVGEIVTG